MATNDIAETPPPGDGPATLPDTLPREQRLQDLCKAFLLQLHLADKGWWHYTTANHPFHGRIRLPICPGQAAELVWLPKDGDDAIQKHSLSQLELREAVERAWPQSFREFDTWGRAGVKRRLLEVERASDEDGNEGFPWVFIPAAAESDKMQHAHERVWYRWCQKAAESVQRSLVSLASSMNAS